MRVLMVIVVSALAARATFADVFHMPPGQTSLEFVTVGDPGDLADVRGYGAVAYSYQMGKYEVTAGQYTAFLNAVAATDTNGLYDAAMWNGAAGCKILRSGSPGSYSYSVPPDYANRPVNWVSFWDAARFANWLHNGQPSGLQGPETTEAGAYINIGLNTFERQPGATFVIPTEDEWYKAAYYKGGGPNAGYWLYPTRSDSPPGRDLSETYNPGNNGNFWASPGDPIDNGRFTTEAGAFQLSRGPYGTFDQAGNVWEWNEAVIEMAGLVERGSRGGSFGQYYFSAASSARSLFEPVHEDFILGFRVAALRVPEPDSLAALIAGAVAALVWLCRRRTG